MDNYSIIKDEAMLERFIQWLPALHVTETFYLSLLARNKYCEDIHHIRSDRQQLKRVTANKLNMIDKIRQMECPLGSYKQKDTPIPQVALSLYIHPNPRDLKLAGINTCKKLVDLVTMDYNGYSPQQVAISEIQAAKKRKIFVDFDYDNLTYPEFRDAALNKIINQEACSILKTHGGLHVLVKPSAVAKEFEKDWYMRLSDLIADDDKAIGDLLMPVPGCTQGNYTPYFLTMNGVTQ